jgi:L-threonylcarbamoyladenylate synthase
MGTRRRRVSVKQGRSKLLKWDDLRMKIISNPTRDEIKMAAKALKDGHLVAFPTETVYGLGADATNERAVSRIYSVKGRPTDHPLIVHISSINQLNKWARDIPNYAMVLAKDFWPGPMTLILKRSELAKNFITGGQNSIGVRVPSEPVAIALLNEFEFIGGQGIAAPSANKFGAVSATDTNSVVDEIGNNLEELDSIIDTGKTKIGLESTIIDCTKARPKILRPGAITSLMISKSINIPLDSYASGEHIKTSGMFKSHYSPKTKIIFDRHAEQGEGLVALERTETPIGVLRIMAPKNIEEFAKELYSSFRMADSLKLETLVIEIPEGIGLAEAIKDRVEKASAKNEY